MQQGPDKEFAIKQQAINKQELNWKYDVLKVVDFKHELNSQARSKKREGECTN